PTDRAALVRSSYACSASSFLSSSPRHPAPPSFPTRRSSDLFLSDHHTVIVPVGSTEQHGPHLALSADVLIPQEVARRDLLRDEQDRKSTRLNSSHGSISYAVFCLKKKKTTT